MPRSSAKVALADDRAFTVGLPAVVRAGGPQREAGGGVDDEVAVSLHDEDGVGVAAGFTYAFTDNHGTPTLYLDNTAENPTWRQHANANPSGNGGHDPGADNGSGGGCDSYCQWLKKPTPYQPSLDDRCGNRGEVPASVCHKGTLTYADALEPGSSNSDNWYWSCSAVMKLDPTTCGHRNPFANPHGLAAGLSIVALFATAYTGGLVGIASLPEAMLFAATQDATVLTSGGAALTADSAGGPHNGGYTVFGREYNQFLDAGYAVDGII
jgi:hypothetical protein